MPKQPSKSGPVISIGGGYYLVDHFLITPPGMLGGRTYCPPAIELRQLRRNPEAEALLAGDRGRRAREIEHALRGRK